MNERKREVVEAGRWLARERGKRGKACSTTLVAVLASKRSQMIGEGQKIHQQSISAIENADADKGPAKLPSWWRHIRWLFDSGEIDRVMSATEAADPEGGEDKPEELFIQTASGEIVGRLILSRRNLQ